MEMSEKIKICSTCKIESLTQNVVQYVRSQRINLLLRRCVINMPQMKPNYRKKHQSRGAGGREKYFRMASILFMGRCWLGCTYLCDNGSCSNFWSGIWMVFTSTYLIMMGSLLVTAILTIIAFYKRNSNTVALATSI